MKKNLSSLGLLLGLSMLGNASSLSSVGVKGTGKCTYANYEEGIEATRYPPDACARAREACESKIPYWKSCYRVD